MQQRITFEFKMDEFGEDETVKSILNHGVNTRKLKDISTIMRKYRKYVDMTKEQEVLFDKIDAEILDILSED